MKRLVGIDKQIVMILGLVLAACGGESGGTPDAAIVVNSGTYYHFVADSLDIGCKCGATCNPTCADTYAFDLDNDSRHRPDNALGHVLIALQAANGIQIQQAITDALNAGTFVVLGSMRADSLTTDSSVSFQVFIGTPTAPTPPVLSGGGNFTVSPSSPTNAKVLGNITGGTFLGGPGEITLNLTLVAGSTAIPIKLIHAMFQADCTGGATGACINGKLGGAVPVSDISNNVIPAIATQLDNRMVLHMCNVNPANPPASCTSQDKQILALFDACGAAGTPDAGLGVCGNGRIEVDEVRYNPIVQAVLQPDMDLLKADGTPGQDGVKESISLGLGVTMKNAVFTAPGE